MYIKLSAETFDLAIITSFIYLSIQDMFWYGYVCPSACPGHYFPFLRFIFTLSYIRVHIPSKTKFEVYRNHPVCPSVQLCPGHIFLMLAWTWIIFHTTFVHGPRICLSWPWNKLIYPRLRSQCTPVCLSFRTSVRIGVRAITFLC